MALLSWVQHQDRAKRSFQQGDYQDALTSYQLALETAPQSEHQVLLSNIVACRIHIGNTSREEVELAISEAQECIALNPRWAKGHVRLASAYILANESNNACNSLQRAIQLDPRNQMARQMLMRQLRRRDQARNNNSNPRTTTSTTSANNNNYPQPTAPPSHQDVDETINDAGVDEPSYTSRPSNNYNTDAGGIDDSQSLRDKFFYWWGRLEAWYHSHPQNIKNLIKVGAFLVILYVLFGGRFGFGPPERLGNYQAGNPYDNYRQGGASSSNYHTDRQSSSSQYGTSYSSYPYGSPHGNNNYNNNYGRSNNNYHHSDGYGNYGNRGRRYGSSSWSSWSLMDGSISSMLMIAGMFFVCNQLGVNPFHALFMMNMFTGRRAHRPFMMMGPMMGMGGFGMANGWFGNPFRRRRQFFQRRGGWY